MSRNGVYVRVLLVVIALATFVAFLNRTNRRSSHDTWLPSSFNPVGAGMLAFYRTLEEAHWPVARWREPLTRLDGQGTGNVLVMTRSPVGASVAFDAQEAEVLDRWVQKGNTLLLLGPFARSEDGRALLTQFGFAFPASGSESGTGFLPAWATVAPNVEALPVPSEKQTGTLVLPSTAPLPEPAPTLARPLWTANGATYALDLPRGAGQVLCVASAEVMDNAYLPQGDNFAIVVRWLAPGGRVPHHVFFEESHHGYSTVYALAGLVDHPGVRFAALLALLGFATFLGSTFIRFGPVVPLPQPPGRSALEYVDSIAELYHRADLRNEMIRFLYDDAHRAILHRLNLPPATAPELVAARFQAAYPALPSWKKLAHRFDSTDYVAGLPPTGWLRVARELMQIKTALA